MAQIETSKQLSRAVEELAVTWIELNPEKAIECAVEVMRRERRQPPPLAKARSPHPDEEEVLEFDGWQPPNLTYTDLISVMVDNQRGRAFWNYLLRDMVNRLSPDTDFQSVIHVNFVPGHPPNESFRYCPDADISIQYQATNRVWRTVAEIAYYLEIDVIADFQWVRGRPGKTTPAYPPGQRGRLVLKNHMRDGHP